MKRLLRGVALAVGYAAMLALALAAAVLLVRFVQVRVFTAPAAPEHAEEKQAYLAALPRLDAAAAPNVVVVFFDDLGWGDLGVYGNRLIRTPRIDRFAGEGVRMTAFYSASPVCTPSRAALLTGRYPVRSNTHRQVFFNEPGATIRRMLGWGNEIPTDEILLPEVLRAAGYATGMVGKWHLGGEPGHMPNDLGFDSWYGVLWSNDMAPLHLYRDGEIEERDGRRGVGLLRSFRDEDDDRSDGIDQRTLTRRYTAEAVDFLGRNRDRPFFLYLAYTAPHVPHFADPEHAGSSEAGLYGDVVEDLDRSVGAVLDALDDLGLAERTLVIVTSDNGADYNGSPGSLRGRKGETYEGGQRVPMVARYPGRLPPGVVRDEMAMNIDVFPTVLALAGLPEPSDRIIDGRDIGPLLARGGASPHETLYYFSSVLGSLDAARDPRFKYREKTGDFGRSKPQLWRMDRDAESHNLALRYPDDAARLAGALRTMREEIDDDPRGWR